MNTELRFRILIVDDDPMMCTALQRVLRSDSYELFSVASGHDAIALMSSVSINVLILDYQLPGLNGIQILQRVRELAPHACIVLMSGNVNVEIAVEAMKLGAHEVLNKPFDFRQVRALVHSAYQIWKLRRSSNQGLDAIHRAGDLVGNSVHTRNLREFARRVANKSTTILITGNSGTGKEELARCIHRSGENNDEPFVVVDVTSLNSQVIESELFGHGKGAYTGADSARTGLVRSAANGTVFIDEIGELPLELQSKLLRVLQEREVRPVGSDTAVQVDCRFIVATNRNLQEQVQTGQFREDLYYRLDVLHIKMPDLQDRSEDIPVLAEYFRQRFAHERPGVSGFDDEALYALSTYAWPGNVRELQNVILRAMVIGTSGQITLTDLPSVIQQHRQAAAPEPHELSLSGMERRLILQTLEMANGNRRAAARILGISISTLYRRLAKYQIPHKYSNEQHLKTDSL